MKRQVFKGEITVFLSLVFVLIVSLVGSMVQSVSIQITRSMKRADTELAIESVFAEYNKEMLEEYGLFVKVGRDEKEISERLWFYGADEMEHEIRRMQLFTDDGGEAFYEQAIRAMGGEVLPIEKVSDTSIEKAEKQNAKELETLLQEEEQELPTQNNPIESVNQLKKSSLLSLILPNPEELSNQCVVLEELPSHRTLQKGEGKFPVLKEDDVLKKAFFVTYLTEHFPDFTQNPEEHPMFYEAEYLLAGKESDQKNLETVAKKILSIRMALNYAYLLTDKAKQAEAETMATALATALKSPALMGLIKQAILFSWAYGESILDMRVLYKGERVPVVKSSENWQLQLENLVKLGTSDEVQEEKEVAEGMDYGDYIKAFLFMEEKEKLCMRAMDLLELNLGIQMDDCVTAMEVESTLEIQMGIQDVFLTEFQYE